MSYNHNFEDFAPKRGSFSVCGPKSERLDVFQMSARTEDHFTEESNQADFNRIVRFKAALQKIMILMFIISSYLEAD